MAKMYAHITEPPPLVTDARPDAPPRSTPSSQRAMAKDPDDRYQSAGELATAATGGASRGRAARSSTAERPSKPPLSGRIRRLRGLTRNEQVSRRTKVAIGIALPTCSSPGSPPPGLRAAGVFGGPTTRPSARGRRRRATVAAARLPEATVAPPTGQPKAVATIKVGQGAGRRRGQRRAGVRGQPAGRDAVGRSIPRRTRSTATRSTPGTRPDGVVAGKGVVWVGGAGDGPVRALPGRGRDRPDGKVPVGDRPEAIALGKQLRVGRQPQRQHGQPRSTGRRRRSSAARSASATSRRGSSSAAASSG